MEKVTGFFFMIWCEIRGISGREEDRSNEQSRAERSERGNEREREREVGGRESDGARNAAISTVSCFGATQTVLLSNGTNGGFKSPGKLVSP